MKRNIKVLILSDPSSSHTSKWINSLHRKGVELMLFGLSAYNPNEYDNDIKIRVIDFSKSAKSKTDGDLRKIVYLKSIFELKNVIKYFQPNIIHAHYASSYGLIGALSNFKPLLVSIWGNDVYDFPKKSFIHKKTFQYVLKRTLRIYSTSKIMAKEVNKYTNKYVKVIPFGIDTDIFKPMKTDKLFDSDTIALGAVKSLSYKYGNDSVVQAFKIVKEKIPNCKIKLILVGDGILRSKIEKLVNQLKLNDDVIFIGQVPHSQVPMYHNLIDIHIYPSLWESFGVSNLEAAACEKVQVASNIGGFTEILTNGEDSFLVNPNSPEAIADKLILLIQDESLRIKMGKKARENVIKNFNWNDNVDTMIEEYDSVIRGKK